MLVRNHSCARGSAVLQTSESHLGYISILGKTHLSLAKESSSLTGDHAESGGKREELFHLTQVCYFFYLKVLSFSISATVQLCSESTVSVLLKNDEEKLSMKGRGKN